MSVVCGIDFSESSAKAAEVAVGIAAGLKLPLYLVHALSDWPSEVYADVEQNILTATRRALDREAERLGRRRADIYLRVEPDGPESALVRVAQEESAKLLIVGATGRRHPGRQTVGRTADQLAQRSQVPTLLVRAVEPFTNWSQGYKPLQVLVGLDFNLVSDDAWNWTLDLARVGPIEVVGAHVYWPPTEWHRIGLSGTRSYVDPDPEVDRVLRRELEARFRPKSGASVRFRPEPGMGRSSDHLLSVATELKADLIVVGSHQRNAVARLWERSVSRGVLHDAQGSVACVALCASNAARREPEARAALAATDFSTVGNAALEHAYRQVGAGGKVYLVHVLAPGKNRSEIEPKDIFAVSSSLAERKKSAEEQLRSLVPLRSTLHDKSTEILVLESRDPADAIAQSAERLGVDIVCLGTHGRSGLAKAVLGSVAQEVLSKTQRPVLFVPAPRE